MYFRPVHMVSTDEKSCGAADRFLRERVVVTLGKDTWVHNVKWQREREDTLTYRADPDAFMTMSLEYSDTDAYLTIEGIDAARKPCRDTVYLVRARR